MRNIAERHLVELVIAVSLGLTGLTVWAVAQQGRALRARELSDLRSSAASAAAERQASLRAELERAFDTAGRAWDAGEYELDAWCASRREWLLTFTATSDGTWKIFPRTPLEAPLPSPETEPAPGGRDLLARLRDFQGLAANPDPLTRAGALLAMAACEQQLGHPLAAARIFADAAHLLRSTPRLARFAFRAELDRIDSLLTAGDRERAHESFTAFLNGLLMDHPARLGAVESARLQQQAERLALKADDPASAALRALQTRAERREAIADAAARVLTGRATDPRDAERIELVDATTAGGETIVVAIRALGEDARAALVEPAAELVARCWKSRAEGARWRVRMPGEPAGQPVLVQLGLEFAQAVLEPTAATAEELHSTARRHLHIVLLTAAGTAGAWVLVLWMMVRVVARQRELARLQGRFVADVSHELKTPLALIRLLAETLAGQRVRDPQKVQAYHETITRESERLSVLLDNILDLGRIESGRKVYEFARCNVAEVARQAWTLFEPQFAADGFEARLELAESLPAIRADAQALQQVMVNLLQNAYRYAGEGKFVRLAVQREGYIVLITVEDHGIGMNRNELDRLGESFFRADDTRVRQTRGVGLGLAIVHHIVTAHGGKIEVQSRPGQGSKFTIWIPFEPADEA